MEVYSNTAQEVDWDGAWAAMARTEAEAAEEARIEAERSERQSFEKGLEDYLDAQAKSAAEEAAAEEEAAEAAEARRRANYRSKRDGLTQNERALLREPTRYQIEEVGPGHWWAAHRDCEAIFAATKVDGRTLRIVSNVGSEYTCHVEDDYSVTCGCEHAKRMREVGHNGLCKHGAVTVAVADFNRAQRAAQVPEPQRIAA